MFCNINGTHSAPASEIYEKAQQTSAIISGLIFSFNTFPSKGIQLLILVIAGIGLYLHKLAIVQDTFLVKLVFGSNMFIN